jgi:deoxyribose-phosphate aldolase
MNLNQYIDHTLLKPEVTEDQVVTLCEEAKEYEFAAVCVNSVWVAKCAEELKGTAVKVATVVGFPLGASTSSTKSHEAKEAIYHGAAEIDMVMNIGALKSGDTDLVKKDIAEVVKATSDKAIVKVILETGVLSQDEIKLACELAVQAGAHYVKTSTGFGPGGAEVSNITLMRKIVGPDIGVKASGGIRDQETALAMIQAGATRIGASAGIAIVRGVHTAKEGY